MAAAGGASGRKAIVIGAGIVGACTAAYLKRDGFAVDLIERDEVGRSASYGNAGNIGVTSFTPHSTPGLIWKVPGMLFNPDEALEVRWSYFPRALPFFIRFLLAGRPDRVQKIADARKELLTRVYAAYKPLLDDTGVNNLIVKHGKLFTYGSPQSFEAGKLDRDIRRSRGVEIIDLDEDQIRQQEPALAGGAVKRAILIPEIGHAPDPLRLTQSIAEAFVRNGGRVLRETARAIEMSADGKPTVVTDKGSHTADIAVISAGAWSNTLAKPLGAKVPMETERGYHLMFPDPRVELRRPFLSNDRNVTMTPMDKGIRITSFAEFGGLEAPPTWKLADRLVKHARELVPGINTEKAERWMGHRPSTPDSLPVIDRCKRHPSVYYAYGHGHTGLTLGAITGRLIADLVAGRDPAMDLTPYRADRF
jgi:D-amino-acid dehydrogenase